MGVVSFDSSDLVFHQKLDVEPLMRHLVLLRQLILGYHQAKQNASIKEPLQVQADDPLLDIQSQKFDLVLTQKHARLLRKNEELLETALASLPHSMLPDEDGVMHPNPYVNLFRVLKHHAETHDKALTYKILKTRTYTKHIKTLTVPEKFKYTQIRRGSMKKLGDTNYVSLLGIDALG